MACSPHVEHCNQRTEPSRAGDTHTTRSPRTVHGARRRTDTTMCAARLAAVCGLARHRPRAYAATRQHTGTSHAHDPRAIITTPLTSKTSSSTRRKPTPDAAVTIGLKASHAVCTPPPAGPRCLACRLRDPLPAVAHRHPCQREQSLTPCTHLASRASSCPF